MARKINLSRRQLLAAAIVSPLATAFKLPAEEVPVGPPSPAGHEGELSPVCEPGPAVIEPQFFMFEGTGDVICHPAAVAAITAHLAEQQDG